MADTSAHDTTAGARLTRRAGHNAGIALTVAGIAFMGLGTLTGGSHAAAASPITGGLCLPQVAATVSDVQKNISTDQGCDVASGQADYPITGWLAYNPGAGTTVQLGDFYEGLSAHKFYSGAYSLTFGTCLDGSATSGNYTVTAGTGDYPNTMPTFSGTLATVTGGGIDGKVVCPYSLTVGSEPSVSGDGNDKLSSSKNDLWIASGNEATSHHTATNSVKPPTIPNTTTSTSTSTTTSATSTSGVSGSSTTTSSVQGVHTPGTGLGGSDLFFGGGLLLVISGIGLTATAVARRRRSS